jgi:hypothetical protein
VSQPEPNGSVPLCRFNGHTCAACCWGSAIDRADLVAALRRHRRLFRPLLESPRLPGRWRLLWHELATRRGLDLLWAVLLLVPGLADWLRLYLKPRLVCAFLGFVDDTEERVGCLLHPTRWGGHDVRRRAAFALLRGIGCGAADYLCLAARLFARAGWQERRRLARTTEAMDWHQYSQAAHAYRHATAGRPPT